MTTVPCLWEINVDNCAEWDSYDQTTREAAKEFATLIMWAATGRRFGLCVRTVRPCGTDVDRGTGVMGFEGGWLPYVVGGGWRLCGCVSGCGCVPNCQVLLPGPVAQVTQVVQDGLVVDPGSYRVDDHRWLVRTDGGCWPTSQDMSVNEGAFEVTYAQGIPVPGPLREAAGTVACEYAKARGGKECRLPGRLSSLARQGVQVTMLDTDSLTRRGFTGIPEVDQIIAAYNPHGLHRAPRVMSPDVAIPRQRTS